MKCCTRKDEHSFYHSVVDIWSAAQEKMNTVSTTRLWTYEALHKKRWTQFLPLGCRLMKCCTRKDEHSFCHSVVDIWSAAQEKMNTVSATQLWTYEVLHKKRWTQFLPLSCGHMKRCTRKDEHSFCHSVVDIWSAAQEKMNTVSATQLWTYEVLHKKRWTQFLPLSCGHMKCCTRNDEHSFYHSVVDIWSAAQEKMNTVSTTQLWTYEALHKKRWTQFLPLSCGHMKCCTRKDEHSFYHSVVDIWSAAQEKMNTVSATQLWTYEVLHKKRWTQFLPLSCGHMKCCTRKHEHSFYHSVVDIWSAAQENMNTVSATQLWTYEALHKKRWTQFLPLSCGHMKRCTRKDEHSFCHSVVDIWSAAQEKMNTVSATQLWTYEVLHKKRWIQFLPLSCGHMKCCTRKDEHSFCHSVVDIWSAAQEKMNTVCNCNMYTEEMTRHSTSVSNLWVSKTLK